MSMSDQTLSANPEVDLRGGGERERERERERETDREGERVRERERGRERGVGERSQSWEV